MLVLTRKVEQKIQIGDNITVTILRVKGQTVRVGIEAPQDVRVLRAELPRIDDGVELSLNSPASAVAGRPSNKLSRGVARDRTAAGAALPSPSGSVRIDARPGTDAPTSGLKRPHAEPCAALAGRVAARRTHEQAAGLPPLRAR